MVEWISVKNKRPDKSHAKYLVYSPEYGTEIGIWFESSKMWFVNGAPAKVTHWAELPESKEE